MICRLCVLFIFKRRRIFGKEWLLFIGCFRKQSPCSETRSQSSEPSDPMYLFMRSTSVITGFSLVFVIMSYRPPSWQISVFEFTRHTFMWSSWESAGYQFWFCPVYRRSYKTVWLIPNIVSVSGELNQLIPALIFIYLFFSFSVLNSDSERSENWNCFSVRVIIYLKWSHLYW